MTTSSATLRRRGPPPCFYPRAMLDEQRRLLKRLDESEPQSGAAKIIYNSLKGAG